MRVVSHLLPSPHARKERVWTHHGQPRSKKVGASLSFCPCRAQVSGALLDNFLPLFAITVSAEVNGELLSPFTPAPAAGESLRAGRAAQGTQWVVPTLSIPVYKQAAQLKSGSDVEHMAVWLIGRLSLPGDVNCRQQTQLCNALLSISVVLRKGRPGMNSTSGPFIYPHYLLVYFLLGFILDPK